MNKEYDYVFPVNNHLSFPMLNIRINHILSTNPKAKILIEVPDTTYLNKSIVESIDPKVKIRIAGAYDDLRLKIYETSKFTNATTNEQSDCKTYYYDSVIYSKNEVLLILKEIENIEKGISKNFSDIEKLIYLYTKVKRSIMYDPKYETRTHSEVRSLRGLISHESVCAGFALIMKELLDRQGITSYFVRGNKHAWNIVEIEGELYPIDVTYENSKFRSGMDTTFKHFGQSVKSFNKKHKPDKREPFKGYESDLKDFDPVLVDNIYKRIFRNYDYKSTTFLAQRNEKERCVIIQLGTKVVDNVIYYKYYYVELNGKTLSKTPMIFYTRDNICKYVDNVRFSRKGNFLEKEDIIDGLFSKENIDDSNSKDTICLGYIDIDNNRKVVIKDDKELVKFKKNYKVFNRSNGTTFILEANNFVVINGTKVNRYNIYEIVKEDNKFTIKSNVIYSEKDLMNDDSKLFKDVFLSQERIKVKDKDNCGYVGRIDKNGSISMDKLLVDYFKPNKTRSITSYNEERKKHIHIPTFMELEDLYKHYGTLDSWASKCSETLPLVFSMDNSPIENKSITAPLAYFANIWRETVGIDAFSDGMDKLYNDICAKFIRDIRTQGVIDTVGIFFEIKPDKENLRILYSLFSDQKKTDFINDLFHRAIKKNADPKKLPNIIKDDSNNKTFS